MCSALGKTGESAADPKHDSGLGQKFPQMGRDMLFGQNPVMDHHNMSLIIGERAAGKQLL
ncbi:hypothetical protein D3C73_718300 [compost metagenome]